MASHIQYEEINLDDALGPATPQEKLLSINAIKLLWEIQADSDLERRIFTKILQILKAEKSLSVPLQKLQELGINPARTPLVRKLMQKDYAKIQNAQLTLTQPDHNQFTLKKFTKELDEQYKRIRLESERQELRFPTRGWRKLPLTEITSIELDKINWLNLNDPGQIKDLLEITFPGGQLPSILMPRDQYNRLTEIALSKIKYNLVRFAGEKPDFFSERIKNNQNMIRGKANRILEHEIGQINRKTSRGYREEYTKIVLDKILKSPDYTILFISDLASETNNHILTEFSYTNPKNYDFLQSFEYLKTVFLKSKEMTHITLSSLVGAVLDDLKLYTTTEQLKWDVLGENPDLSEEKYEEIYQKFVAEFIQKNGTTGIPKVIAYPIRFQSGEEEVILIHSLNLARYLDLSLSRLTGKVLRDLEIRWHKRLLKHEILDEYYSPKAFQKEILSLIHKKDERLYKVLHKPSLYRYLYNLPDLPPTVERLKVNGTDKIDQVFQLNRDKLYQSVLASILEDQTRFQSWIFRLLHWFAKRQFSRETKNQTEKKAKKAIQSPWPHTSPFLLRFGLSSEGELKEGLEDSWNHLPKSGLERSDLDTNILTEINAFFGTKEEVPVNTLQIIVDSNTVKTLKAAPFLQSYEKELKQYIKFKIIQIVYTNSRLRNRCLL